MGKIITESRKDKRTAYERRVFSTATFFLGAILTIVLYSENMIFVGAIVLCLVLFLAIRLIVYMGKNITRTALRFIISFALGVLLAMPIIYLMSYIRSMI